MFEIQRQAGPQNADNRVLVLVFNATAATLARGAVVQYLTAADGSTCDGFSVTTPTTNYLDLVCGVVADNPTSAPGQTGILTLTTGFVVCYGVTAYAARLGAEAMAVGDKLVPVAGQTYLTYVAAGDGRDGMFCCLSSYASSAGARNVNISVYVHAM